MQASLKIRSTALMALAIMVTLVLQGCESPIPRGGDSDSRYAETRANRLVRAGRHEQAAEIFEQIAATASDPDRFWLSAARERYAADNWQDVLRDLARISGALAVEDATERALLGASAALSMGDVPAAKAWLSNLPDAAPESARPAVLWVQTRMALAQGDVNTAIDLTAERELWLSRSEEVVAGRQALLDAMQAQHADGSLAAAADGDEPLLAGWLKLARILAEADRDPFVVRSALRDWQQAYTDHPAQLLLPDLLAGYRKMLDYPQQLAILLPLSGRLQAAGGAVRDGLVSAYLRHDEERPRLRFYDVNERNVSEVYGRAILEGADLVIGPLTRESVAALAQSDSLPVPALALNNLPDEIQALPGLYQFGLTPEDEARQVARRLLADGLVQGVALAPASDWGRRMLQAFTSEMELAGGILLDHQEYPPRGDDFTSSITTILHLAESQQRYRALSGVLGRRIEFEPRRRQDVQFIFLAATADAGRLIRPQLRFHYASDLPVYATSAIFEPAPDKNGDLNGVMFDDIPWTIDDNPEILDLRKQFSAAWPQGMRNWPRLYALGFDAYRLVPALFSGQLMEEQQVKGLTGDLSMSADGQIHRQLMWARFENGVPVRIRPPGLGEQDSSGTPH